MAEVVEYRLENSTKGLQFLSEFGVLTNADLKEIETKRKEFEYKIIRRKKDKLDYLNYIRFEIKFVKFLENYRKSLMSDKDKLTKICEDPLLRRLFLTKLSQLILESCGHISKLFRKMVTTYQFDSRLWLAYIDFALSKKWNTRVSALYWRLLRIKSDDPNIWISAAEHEIEINKANDTARGLYLRALRHHPKSVEVWVNYFNMEMRYMKTVDQRAKILSKITKSKDVDCWDEDPNKDENIDDSSEVPDPNDGDFEKELEKYQDSDNEEIRNEIAPYEPIPKVRKPIGERDKILTGHLPIVVYDQATNSLIDMPKIRFAIYAMKIVLESDLNTKGVESVYNHMKEDCITKSKEHCEFTEIGALWQTLSEVENVNMVESLKRSMREFRRRQPRNVKKLKPDSSPEEVRENLADIYRDGGIEAVRKLRTIDLDHASKFFLRNFVSHLEMELVELQSVAKDKKEKQIEIVRYLYEKALNKLGNQNPKLWYEYILFERKFCSKNIEHLDRMNQLLERAKSTLKDPHHADQVLEKFTLIQMNSALDYSDYEYPEDQ